MRSVTRRPLLVLLVCFLAMWGAGLPRFAHVMIEHGGLLEPSASSCASCCGSCSVGVAQDDDAARAADDEDREPATPPHDCATCDLLATLIAPAPAAPTSCVAAAPRPASVLRPSSATASQRALDAYAPRGPPLLGRSAI